MNAKLVVNQEHHGLELYFSEKPSEEVLTQLKAASWRYHRVKKCWYARQSAANQEIAARFAGEHVEGDMPAPAAESFFPAYDRVDSVPICRSSDLSCWENDYGYFQDIQAYVEVRVSQICIVDLRNALIPGRECERLVLQPHDLYSSECLHSGLDTFRAVYEKFFVRRELPDCHVYASRLRSMNVFTPFKEIRPIKAPTKWTLPHVWKAILSGQIYEGKCDGHYTDDYAYDAAVDFRSGVRLHLPSFAKELIESPSGWSVYTDHADGDCVQLSVNCYSFDMNTLQFDAKCDWAENRRRAQERADKLNAHNAAMESRRLSDEQVRALTESGLLFDAQIMTMNENTGYYEEKTRTLLRGEFFYDDSQRFDVLSIAEHPVRDEDLLEVDGCAELQSDPRVICTEDHTVVSGRALKEMLRDEETAQMISSVMVRRQTWEQLRESLEDWRCGRTQNLFNPIPRSRFAEAIARLDAERARLSCDTKEEVIHA